MIIRRKHTANFTTIGNALFNDERLQADEVGIIGYLLSRPHDWEVRRPQLAKRFGYGREAIKRVIWSGMRHGWIIAQKTRLTDGKMFVIYEVRDAPGPELSDDEIRNALSLASSGATETDSEGDGADETSTDPPADGQPPPTGDPATGQRGVGQPATANPYVVPIEGTTKYGFNKDESTKDARAFVDVKRAWPAVHILSDVASESAFLGLGDADKDACVQGIRPYLDDCKAQNRKVCDLATYIRERRWERFAAKRNSRNEIELVYPGTPQWHRWSEYYLAIGDEQKFRTMDSRAERNLPYDAPSEWPPSLAAKTG